MVLARVMELAVYPYHDVNIFSPVDEKVNSPTFSEQTKSYTSISGFQFTFTSIQYDTFPQIKLSHITQCNLWTFTSFIQLWPNNNQSANKMLIQP